VRASLPRLTALRTRLTFAWALAIALSILFFPTRARAAAEADGGCGTGHVCGLDDLDGPSASSAGETPDAAATVTLLFFWGVGCPHCEEARPAIESLAREHPRLRVEPIEVRRDPEGRRRFVETMQQLGAEAVGVPTFVLGSAYVVGYAKGETDQELRAMIEAALSPEGAGRADAGPPPEAGAPDTTTVMVPWLGEVDPSSASLPWLTLFIGLADGVNPCAIWVLVVLLGILLHVETPRRMLLYAGTFVVMSGVVYFVFMTAWVVIFSLMGLSRLVTIVLGVALSGMGLINLKDVVWFKKGPSLVISDKVKPGLYRRMRAIAGAASTPAAIGGIAALAFVVNLVELGCTLGLPAVYTRILTLRGLAIAPRLAYIALYNVVYVVPLLVVLAAFVGVRRRLVLTERVARALKGVSGILLTAFGALFILAPELLVSR
jgi:thiol-disulfide isomerase/thioredoxin